MKKPKRTPAQVKQENNDVQYVLKSNGFKVIREHLGKNHPINKGLGPEATQEQRAFHQIRCQEYQGLMLWLDSWVLESKISNLETTYEAEKNRK